MRHRSSLLVAAALVLLGLTSTPARAVTASVEVRDNYFFAARTSIEPGSTVEWTLVGNGHSVTADDGSFDFPPNQDTLSTGDKVSFTFNQRGVFYFHCKIHGFPGSFPQGMTGAIYVGVPLGGTPGEVRHVPSEYRSVAEALHGAAPGTTISLAPRTYPEAVQINAPGITLRGEGSPDDVVIDGGGAPTAVDVRSSDVTIEHLSVREADTGIALGLDFSRISNAKVRDIHAEGGSYGIRSQAKNASISDFWIVGSRSAGVEVACDSCGTVVEGGSVEHSAAGILIERAMGVAVRAVTLVDNDDGVMVLNSQAVDVSELSVTGGALSIVVNHDLGPTTNVRVFNNTVTGYGQAGLAWDLVGARVCFSNNVDPATPGGPKSNPPMLQTLFPCPHRL
jgi:plastocyanin